jgi:hypothetical protein
MGLKWSIAQKLAPYPRLFYPLARLFGPRKFRGYLVDRDKELVISGYPRSANTFAAFAFLEAQGRPVKLARHLHVEAEILEAVRLGIPAVVVVRKPDDAIRSLKAALPGIDENKALARWVNYYTRIEPLRDRIVVSDFARTTRDFGGVIDELNARFGTSFRRFETTDENCARVFARIERDQEILGTQRFSFSPSKERQALLEGQELKFDPQLLARAQELYGRMKALGAGPAG